MITAICAILQHKVRCRQREETMFVVQINLLNNLPVLDSLHLQKKRHAKIYILISWFYKEQWVHDTCAHIYFSRPADKPMNM